MMSGRSPTYRRIFTPLLLASAIYFCYLPAARASGSPRRSSAPARQWPGPRHASRLAVRAAGPSRRAYGSLAPHCRCRTPRRARQTSLVFCVQVQDNVRAAFTKRYQYSHRKLFHSSPADGGCVVGCCSYRTVKLAVVGHPDRVSSAAGPPPALGDHDRTPASATLCTRRPEGCDLPLGRSALLGWVVAHCERAVPRLGSGSKASMSCVSMAA